MLNLTVMRPYGVMLIIFADRGPPAFLYLVNFEFSVKLVGLISGSRLDTTKTFNLYCLNLDC